MVDGTGYNFGHHRERAARGRIVPTVGHLTTVDGWPVSLCPGCGGLPDVGDRIAKRIAAGEYRVSWMAGNRTENNQQTEGHDNGQK